MDVEKRKKLGDGRNSIRRNGIISYFGYLIKLNEKSGICNAHKEGEKCEF